MLAARPTHVRLGVKRRHSGRGQVYPLIRLDGTTFPYANLGAIRRRRFSTVTPVHRHRPRAAHCSSVTRSPPRAGETWRAPKITRCDPAQQITPAARKPHLVGINHVALEVGDVEKALSFYGQIFAFQLRGSHRDKKGRMTAAFIDMGDQFLAISEGRRQGPDDSRHFGLVVDNRASVRELAEAAGATMLDGAFLDFLDPWGNRFEIVQYRDVQFTKSEAVLALMDLSPRKSKTAEAELKRKGIVEP